MLKPRVQADIHNGLMVAEFWDCYRLESEAVKDLRTKYEANLKAGGRPEVVIDLLGVAYAGSASLGHFVALHRVARPANGHLIFCNVDPTVLEVFRVSKLENLFTFAADRPAAIALADAPPPADGHHRQAPPSTDPSTPPPTRPTGAGLLSRRKKTP